MGEKRVGIEIRHRSNIAPLRVPIAVGSPGRCIWLYASIRGALLYLPLARSASLPTSPCPSLLLPAQIPLLARPSTVSLTRGDLDPLTQQSSAARFDEAVRSAGRGAPSTPTTTSQRPSYGADGAAASTRTVLKQAASLDPARSAQIGSQLAEMSSWAHLNAQDKDAFFSLLDEVRR